MRGRAVRTEYKNKKNGKALLCYAEKSIQRKRVEVIWCNVRASAIPFYAKNAYLTKGKEYVIPTIEPHIVIYKRLQNV